jgi:trimeric autotransporter adhesin
MTRKILLLITITFLIGKANAQMKLGNNPTATNANALLELETTNKGLLLPRVALTSTSSAAPLSAHVRGMTVFNIVTIGDVTPGIYYSDGTAWVKSSTFAASTLWGTSGNIGTNTAANFIGTTDNTDLLFKRNNVKAALLSLSNTFFGVNSLVATTGNYNVAVGTHSNRDNLTGSENVSVGYNTLATNVAGRYMVAIGHQSQARANITPTIIAVGNTSVGAFSMYGAFDMPMNNTGVENTAIGEFAMYNASSGSKNTVLGRNAGFALTTGSNNTVIGWGQDISTPTTSNQLNISGLIFGTGITGNATAPAGKLGIGTVAPTNTLEVAGTDAIRVPNGTTAERPISIQFGQVRYNTTLGRGEMYVNDVNGDGTLGDAGWRVF